VTVLRQPRVVWTTTSLSPSPQIGTSLYWIQESAKGFTQQT